MYSSVVAYILRFVCRELVNIRKNNKRNLHYKL